MLLKLIGLYQLSLTRFDFLMVVSSFLLIMQSMESVLTPPDFVSPSSNLRFRFLLTACIHAKVVQLAEVDIGRDCAFFQYMQQLFGLGFEQRQRTDRIESLVLDGSLPALEGRIFLEFDDFLHGILPTAADHQRINRHQIGAGDLHVDGRLLVRLVFRVKNPLGCGFVSGFQTGLFTGDPILNEKDAVAAPKQTIPKFHNVPHG